MKLKLPRIVRNFYFISGAFFLIWMLFIDSSDIFSQLKLRQKVSELESRKEYYMENIEVINQQYEERLNDPELMEKFAREKYYMKKKTEDLFVVIEDK